MPINDRAIVIVKKSVVLLFSGQGAQEVGMGKSLVDDFPEAKNIFKNKCMYVGNGVLIPNIQNQAKKNLSNQIISIGGLRWQKNYGTLIQAYKKSTFFEKKNTSYNFW